MNRRQRSSVWVVNKEVVNVDLSTLIYTPKDEENLILFMEKAKIDVNASSETDSEVSDDSPSLFSSVFTPQQIIANVKDIGSHPFKETELPSPPVAKVVRAGANRGGGRRVVKLSSGLGK